MRILVIGAGGVGSAVVPIAARRDFFERMVVADYDAGRAERAIARFAGDERFVAARVDASKPDDVAALCREHAITHVLNAVDPRFVMPIFEGAFAAGADYLDMAMSLSHPHPEAPYERTGVKLGDEQFARADAWEAAGRLALVGRRRRAGPVGHLRALRPGPPVQRDRRSRRPRRGEPRRRGLRLRAVVLDLDDHRGVPQPARDLGSGPRLVHDTAVQRARGLRLPRGDRAGRVRQRRARGGPAHPALGQGQAGHLQVRPRRRVHQRAEGAAHAGSRPDREGPGGWRRGLATGRRGRRAPGPGPAR